MTYRIITYRDVYRVQYRGWSTLGIWATDSYGGYDCCIANDYATLEVAKGVIERLKREATVAARPHRVVYTEKA